MMESDFKSLVPQSNCRHFVTIRSSSFLFQAPGLMFLMTACHDPERILCVTARTTEWHQQQSLWQHRSEGAWHGHFGVSRLWQIRGDEAGEPWDYSASVTWWCWPLLQDSYQDYTSRSEKATTVISLSPRCNPSTKEWVAWGTLTSEKAAIKVWNQ